MHLTLPIDKTFQEEVDRSVLLHSINPESVETINSIVTGLGYGDTIIRGISSHKFIAFFPLEENLDNIDLEFLSIGFKEVGKLNHEDLIHVRKAWVELRGLPSVMWTEEICR